MYMKSIDNINLKMNASFMRINIEYMYMQKLELFGM
jgi:hypothetical protein